MVLTIFFDDPYWIGVIEWQAGETLRVARHVFGAEPGSAEVLAFVLHELDALIQWTDGPASVPASATSLGNQRPRVSPKRLARAAGRALAQHGLSTAAQLALKQEQEAHKQTRQQRCRAEREAERERQYSLARAKARARHRGR